MGEYPHFVWNRGRTRAYSTVNLHTESTRVISMENNEKKQPAVIPNFGLGMGFGVLLGLVLGMALENYMLGLLMGVGLGYAMSLAFGTRPTTGEDE